LPAIFGDSEYVTEGWEKLLKRKRVVVLAEAGAGKSEEFSTQADQVIMSGGKAFYARIERLADGNFAEAIERGTSKDLEAWRSSSDQAFFFLDSVDEARLTHKRFTNALRTIARAIEGGEQRAHIVISSRPSDWRWDQDVASIEQILPVQEATTLDGTERPVAPLSDEALLGSLRKESERKEKEKKDESNVAVVMLVGLTPSKIKLFAGGRGVNDNAAFMQALQDADAMDLVARPQDLEGVIAIWKAHGRIGTHIEALRASIDQRLRETNLDQADLRDLSEEEALQGGRRIAAALSLGQKITIAVPGGDQEREGALDVAEVLPRWRPRHRSALLSRGIFDPATFSRVRFHHREVLELLASDWLLQQIERGCPQETIEGLLFAERHGMLVVRQSMRAVAAWVGQRHARIRKRVLEIAPDLLIEGGDPSLMDVSDRKLLLQKFAEHYRFREDSGASLNIDNIKRLAHPDLAAMIDELWAKNADSPEVRELLLRVVWAGGLKANAGIAATVLRKQSSGDYMRSLSIRALSTAGTREQRAEAIDLVIKNATAWGSRIAKDAIEAFYPGDMTDEQLAALLETTDEREENRVTGIAWRLGQITESGDIGVVDRLLDIVLSLVRRAPHVREAAVSKRYGWLLKPLSEICTRLLSDSNGRPRDALAEAVELIGRHRFRPGYDEDRQELWKVLEDPRHTRHFFWRLMMREIADAQREARPFDGYSELRRHDMLWHLKESDFDWLLEDLKERSAPEERRAALSGALHVWDAHGRDENRLTGIRHLVRQDADLSDVLERYVSPPPVEVTERKREFLARMEERRREGEEERQRDEQWWIDFRDTLRANPRRLSDKTAAIEENFSDLWRLCHWLTRRVGYQSGYSISAWEELIPAFGADVAEAARDGMSAIWRNVDCTAESHSRGMTNAVIAGLMGLAFEARNPRWAASLTTREVQLATRFALKDNGFPNWFGDVVEHDAGTVTEELRPSIAAELRLEAGAAQEVLVLQNIEHTSPGVRNLLARVVLEELERHEPARAQTLTRTLRILVVSGHASSGRFTAIARSRIRDHSEQPDFQVAWLTALLSTNAGAGIEELQHCLQTLPNVAGDNLVMNLLNTMYERGGTAFGGTHTDFLRAEALVPFLTIVLARVRRGEDNQHEDGSYTPDVRDNAQQVRGLLLEKFAGIPGRHTVDTLLALRSRPEWAAYKERLLIWAQRRAGQDGDLIPWKASEVADFEERRSRPIGSGHELYEVSVEILRELKRDLEDGDFSVRDLLRQDARERVEEKPLQLWFARELEKAARARYKVHREVEVIDGNEPDIRVTSDKADGPSSIEIKAADSWNFDELMDALEKQLVGKYMRDQHSRHGILLLTWHGKRMEWDHAGGFYTFSDLLRELERRAAEIRQENSAIDGLMVLGIELTKGKKRSPRLKSRKKKEPRKRKSSRD
jgi:hypothetical protein